MADYKNIKFGQKKFDAIICLNATLPDKSIFGRIEGRPVFAADGAAIKLYEVGIIADYIVGDLDSFYQSPLAGNFDKSKVIHIPDQESNDFEKILKFAKSLGCYNLLILGFHGGELEHTLNNWSVMMRFASELDLCIYDERRYGIPLKSPVKMEVKKDELISLIPQPEALLSTKNLKWELNNETLQLGIREGARNVALKEDISIDIKDGGLFLFIDERLPFAPEFL